MKSLGLSRSTDARSALSEWSKKSHQRLAACLGEHMFICSQFQPSEGNKARIVNHYGIVSLFFCIAAFLTITPPALANITTIPFEELQDSFCAFQDPVPSPCPEPEVVADFLTLPIGIQLDDEFTGLGVTFSGPNITLDATTPGPMPLQQTFVLPLCETDELCFLRMDFDPPVSKIGFGALGLSATIFDEFLLIVNDDQSFIVPPIPSGIGFNFYLGGLRETTGTATISSVKMIIINAHGTALLPFYLANRVAFVSASGVNNPPVADAGMGDTVHPGALVTLDGSASSDPDGHTPLEYDWTFASVPGASALEDDDIANFDTAMPSFTTDVLGDYELQLIVTDSLGLPSAPATVTISTFNTAPFADAGADIAVIEIGSVVQLNGSGSDDLDGDDITYAWTLDQRPAASAAALDDPALPAPSFTADVRDPAVPYVVTLVVTDEFGASSPVPANEDGTVTAGFDNLQPTAQISGPGNGSVDVAVAFDGSGSSDPNLDALTFAWTLDDQPAGSTADLTDAASAQAGLVPDLPGSYTVSLIANDGDLDSSTVNHVFVASSLLDEAKDLAMAADAFLGEIPETGFTNKNSRKPLQNKVGALLISLEDLDFLAAFEALNTDLLKKTDGCALRGSADTGGGSGNVKDWITVCGPGGQQEVYQALKDLDARLRELLGAQTIRVDFVGQVASLTTAGQPGGAPALEGTFAVGDAVAGALVYSTIGTVSGSGLTPITQYDNSLQSMSITVGSYVAAASGGLVTVFNDVDLGGGVAQDAFVALGLGVVGEPVGGLSLNAIQFALGSVDLSSLAGTQIPGAAELLTLEDIFGGDFTSLRFAAAHGPPQLVRIDLTSFTVQEVP